MLVFLKCKQLFFAYQAQRPSPFTGALDWNNLYVVNSGNKSFRPQHIFPPSHFASIFTLGRFAPYPSHFAPNTIPPEDVPHKSFRPQVVSPPIFDNALCACMHGLYSEKYMYMFCIVKQYSLSSTYI